MVLVLSMHVFIVTVRVSVAVSRFVQSAAELKLKKHKQRSLGADSRC